MRSSPSAAMRSAAASIAAAMPLASVAPRPYSRPSRKAGGTYGGTVSRCVERVTTPPRREPHTLARPGDTSCRRTLHPRATSQRATNSTAAPSLNVGDSIARSSAASATTSVIRPS